MRAARVHHATRRRGGGVAARGARAAVRAHAAHRRAHELRRRTIVTHRHSSRRFTEALQELGWTDGRNVRIDTRWAAGDADRIRKQAAEMVAIAPDVILANSSPTVGALLPTTRTVPIVFVSVTDPVGSGFVDSLARPGGNVTGFLSFEYGLSGKWLELLKEIAPEREASGGPSGSRHSRSRPVWSNPVRGAVVRGGVAARRCAWCRRDRARARGLRALAE